jgi:hypothetical protein
MINQVSIFLENKKGRLNETLKILADNNINIKALTIAETIDYGIMRLIVGNTVEAIEILKKNNYRVSITKVLAVRIGDQVGAMYELVDSLTNENIDIQYAYSYAQKHTEDNIIILRIDDELKEKAKLVLENNNNVVLLDENDL